MFKLVLETMIHRRVNFLFHFATWLSAEVLPGDG